MSGLATVSEIGPDFGGAHGATLGRRDTSRAFRRAARHSRRVRRLRIAVPLACVLGVAAVVAITWLQPLRLLGVLPAQIKNLVISGTKIKMEAPKLAGYTRDSRRYEFQATSAAQDITAPHLVELQDIRANMEMPDRGLLDLVARSGLYDSKLDRITLSNQIVVKTPAYEGVLQEAVVEIQAGTVRSEKPVEVRMLKGQLNANRMEITDSGALMRFDGGVNVLLRNDALRGGERPDEAAQ